MKYIFILWIFVIVSSEGTPAVSDSKAKLISSIIESKVDTLSFEVKLLKVDSAEIRTVVDNLYETCGLGHKREITKSKDFEIVSGKEVSTSSGTDHVTRLINAFRDEKLFCREKIDELFNFQNSHEERIEELENGSVALNANQKNAIEIMADHIQNTNEQFAMTKRMERRIDAIDKRTEALEAELVSINDALDRVAAIYELEMKEIRAKLDAFQTQNSCERSWKFNNVLNSCFLFISKKKTWKEAVAFCKAERARLVEIHNSRTHAQVKRMFEEIQLVWDDGKYDGFWVGGSRKGNELNAFVWEESRAPVVWTNWYPLEPYSLQQDCLAIMHNDIFFRWDDQGCVLQNPFICEKVINGD